MTSHHAELRLRADWSGHMNRIQWLMSCRGTGISANAQLFMQAAVCSLADERARIPPSLPNMSSACWETFLAYLGSFFPPPSAQSNPVDRPPAHQLHLHWLAINQRHWHSRASVCGPRADVYSTTQGPGPHASHRDYIIYCIRRGVGSLWRKKGNGTKNKKKICLGARCLSRCWSTLKKKFKKILQYSHRVFTFYICPTRR